MADAASPFVPRRPPRRPPPTPKVMNPEQRRSENSSVEGEGDVGEIAQHSTFAEGEMDARSSAPIAPAGALLPERLLELQPGTRACGARSVPVSVRPVSRGSISGEVSGTAQHAARERAFSFPVGERVARRSRDGWARERRRTRVSAEKPNSVHGSTVRVWTVQVWTAQRRRDDPAARTAPRGAPHTVPAAFASGPPSPTGKEKEVPRSGPAPMAAPVPLGARKAQADAGRRPLPCERITGSSRPDPPLLGPVPLPTNCPAARWRACSPVLDRTRRMVASTKALALLVA